MVLLCIGLQVQAYMHLLAAPHQLVGLFHHVQGGTTLAYLGPIDQSQMHPAHLMLCSLFHRNSCMVCHTVTSQMCALLHAVPACGVCYTFEHKPHARQEENEGCNSD